jgi:hypothetical protein
MNNENIYGLSFLAGAVGITIFSIGASVGHSLATEQIRNEAVKSGVAKWVSNNDGSVKFQFLRGIENEKLVND